MDLCISQDPKAHQDCPAICVSPWLPVSHSLE
jgi:hypothetical protein